MAKKSKPAPAPAAEGEAGADGAPAKKKPPMMLLIAGGVGALVVLGGGGAAAMMMLGKKPAAEAGEHGEAKADHGKEKKAKKGGGGHGGGKDGEEGAAGVVSEGPDGVVFYTLPDMVVNIQAADNRPTFLKLKLTFELPDEEAVAAMEPAAPRLKDMFTTFLRELRPEDLAGSQGSYQLRAEILRRANLVVAPTKVKAVLIEEMLVQ